MKMDQATRIHYHADLIEGLIVGMALSRCAGCGHVFHDKLGRVVIVGDSDRSMQLVAESIAHVQEGRAALGLKTVSLEDGPKVGTDWTAFFEAVLKDVPAPTWPTRESDGFPITLRETETCH